MNAGVLSPDGRRVVTASDDGTPQVWSVLPDCCRSGAEAGRLAGLAEAVGGYEVSDRGADVFLSPDERRKGFKELDRLYGSASAQDLSIAKGSGRVGHRRVALSHVSCAPSSNWTCGFPASSSPTIFFRRRAPQAGQMAHSSYHLIQPTPFVQELIVPVLASGPPTALVFASEP